MVEDTSECMKDHVGRKREDTIDHRSYTHHLNSCENCQHVRVRTNVIIQYFKIFSQIKVYNSILFNREGIKWRCPGCDLILTKLNLDSENERWNRMFLSSYDCISKETYTLDCANYSIN